MPDNDLDRRLRAKRYVRERWVEPVGTMYEPCDADDDGAQAVLRNPDGPEAADHINTLKARIKERDELLREARMYVGDCFGIEDQKLLARINAALRQPTQDESKEKDNPNSE